jgi:hypothetical protein
VNAEPDASGKPANPDLGTTPLTSPADPRGRVCQDRVTDLATPVHYLSLPVVLVLLLYLTHRLWFIGDIFEFFARMQPGSSLSLMVPHNEHWSTIPILINYAIYQLVGLRSFLPYIALAILAHLVVAHLLWRWMRRLGVDPWVATALAAVLLVLGGGADDIEWAFQITWTLPIALGLAGLYLLDFEGPGRWARDAGFWVIAVAALMCSGIGICMLLLGAGVALLRRGWRASLRAAAVPAAVYLAWLAWVRIAEPSLVSTTPAHGSQLLLVPEYVWTGLAGALQGATGWTGLGGVLALGLGYWLIRQRRLARGAAAIAFAGPVVALLFFAIVGVGRVSLGVAEATSGRYVYVWVVLLLPGIALALTQLTQRWPAGRWLTLGLAALVAVNGVAGLAGYADGNAPLDTQEMGEILAAAHLLADGAPLAVGGGAAVEPVRSPDLTVADLRSMIDAGKIPMSTPVTATDILAAALHLQVSVTAAPLGRASATEPSLGGDVQPPPRLAGASCVTLADGTSPSQLELVFAGAGWVSITPTSSGDVSVQLAPEAAPLSLTAPQTFPVEGGRTVYLNVTATGTAPLISLPTGATTVCGVGG